MRLRGESSLLRGRGGEAGRNGLLLHGLHGLCGNGLEEVDEKNKKI